MPSIVTNKRFNESVSIDTQAYNFFIEASEVRYDPTNDPNKKVGRERKAMYHIFEYVDLFIPPTVEREYQSVQNIDLLEKRNKWHLVHLRDIANLDLKEVENIKNKFITKHKHNNDCYALAESEVRGMDYFLTFDFDLKKRLQSLTKVKISTPSEFLAYLKTLNLNKVREPDFLNPLKGENWRKNP